MTKQWAPDCPCRLCRTYLHVGFIYLFFVTYFFKSTTNIMYLIRFTPMLLSCFVFRILAASVDTSRINCNMNQSLSAIRILGVYGSNETNNIKLYLELHFLFTSLCLYICTLCVFVCPLDIGHELDVQQDFQKSSRVSEERFVYVPNADCFKGRYIHLVFTVDLEWSLL